MQTFPELAWSIMEGGEPAPAENSVLESRSDLILRQYLQGESAEAISNSQGVSLDLVNEIVTKHQDLENAAPIVPQYIFSYTWDTVEFYRTHLDSGEMITHNFPTKFVSMVGWCEVPGDKIFMTGGKISFYEYSQEAFYVDSNTFSITNKAPMWNKRFCHASAYYKGFVYVIGGQILRENIRECERYSLVCDKWEPLPPLPKATHGVNAVMIDSSVFVIGGNTDEVQELDVQTLTWRVLPFKLPGPAQVFWYPVFSVGSKVYFIYESKLYSFRPSDSEVKHERDLSSNFQGFCGPSYYNKGILSISNCYGPPERLELGEL